MNPNSLFISKEYLIVLSFILSFKGFFSKLFFGLLSGYNIILISEFSFEFSTISFSCFLILVILFSFFKSLSRGFLEILFSIDSIY